MSILFLYFDASRSPILSWVKSSLHFHGSSRFRAPWSSPSKVLSLKSSVACVSSRNIIN